MLSCAGRVAENFGVDVPVRACQLKSNVGDCLAVKFAVGQSVREARQIRAVVVGLLVDVNRHLPPNFGTAIVTVRRGNRPTFGDVDCDFGNFGVVIKINDGLAVREKLYRRLVNSTVAAAVFAQNQDLNCARRNANRQESSALDGTAEVDKRVDF